MPGKNCHRRVVALAASSPPTHLGGVEVRMRHGRGRRHRPWRTRIPIVVVCPASDRRPASDRTTTTTNVPWVENGSMRLENGRFGPWLENGRSGACPRRSPLLPANTFLLSWTIQRGGPWIYSAGILILNSNWCSSNVPRNRALQRAPARVSPHQPRCYSTPVNNFIYPGPRFA